MRLLLVLLTASAAYAGEFALMANGSRMHLIRHEVDGTRVKLYNDSGYIELPASSIVSFEIEESVLPPVVAPVPDPVVTLPPVPRPMPSPQELADAAADKYNLPRSLVRSVMAAESGFKPEVVSPKGAIGLMQLMPQTALELGADPHDPAQNVDAGVRYLRDLLDRYKGHLWFALAAYNAGPGAVDKYHFVPPYAETINYVIRIDKAYTAAQAAESKDQ